MDECLFGEWNLPKQKTKTKSFKSYFIGMVKITYTK